MSWVIFITIWIILQGIAKSLKELKKFNVGGVIGGVLWSIAMITCLYFAGLYK